MSHSRLLELATACGLLALVAGLPAGALAQDAPRNVRLLSNSVVGSSFNDIWGYTSPAGEELAIIGRPDGTLFFDVTDPENPLLLAFIPGAVSTWRDIKTYGTYCYIVSDIIPSPQSGIQIVDLSDPDNPTLANNQQGIVTTAHNIFIDTDTGLAYVCGAGASAGAQVLDLKIDPVNPILVGVSNTEYIHDIYVKNDIAYAAHVNTGTVGIYDVSTPAAWVPLDLWTYPGAVTHNTWTNDAQTVLATSDETAGGHLKLWDIDPVGAHTQLDQYLPVPTASVHNVFIRGDLCLMSYYTEGLRVVSIADPTDIEEKASYDTYGGQGGLFSGAWGCYPFATDPTIVYISDRTNGLFVLKLIGSVDVLVRDAVTGLPVDGALVEIVETGDSGFTDPAGTWFVNVDPGAATVRVNASGYGEEIVPTSVTLLETTTVDVQMSTAVRAALSREPREGGLRLLGNAPNPFAPRTTIRFALPDRRVVKLRIFDAQGRLVNTVLDRSLEGGEHAVTWDGRGRSGAVAPSGVYFYRVEAAGERAAGRMVIARE